MISSKRVMMRSPKLALLMVDAARVRWWQGHDFYSILDVSPNATPMEIKKGFRKIALTCHPDKVPEAERKQATLRFQLIGEAYEVLSQPALRKKYDTVRPAKRGVDADFSFRDVFRRAAHETEAKTREPPKNNYSTDRDWPHCTACNRKAPKAEMSSCPGCGSGRICLLCDLCSSCTTKGVEVHRPAPSDREEARSGAAGDAAHTKCRPDSERRDTAPVGPRSGQSRNVPRNSPPAGVAARPPRHSGRVDIVPVLIDMGFSRDVAQAARERCGSIEEALEFASRRCEKGPHVPERTDSVVGSQTGKQCDRPERGNRQSAPHTEQDTGNKGNATPDDVEAECVLDLGEILKTLGFSDKDVQEALKRCSTVEAAVDFIMTRGCQGEPRVPDASRSLKVQRLAQESCSAASPPVFGRQPTRPPTAETEPLPDLASSLLAIGFTKMQVDAAVRRCSSLEAAVEWIAANPNI